MNDSKRPPHNTTAEIQSNPMGMLLDMMSQKSPGDAIYAQEAAGQRSFTTSDTLPTRMGEDDRKVLEQAGVVFGDQVRGDEMFTYVTLPAGWKKVPTSHSMWSDLVDDKGHKRASMFYKAAFYDRSASLHTNLRFGIQTDYGYEDANSAFKVNVTDGDEVVFSSEPHSFTEKYSDEYYAAGEAASSEAQAWLDEHYPNWQDASAYWD
jgi:hypothetical protein